MCGVCKCVLQAKAVCVWRRACGDALSIDHGYGSLPLVGIKAYCWAHMQIHACVKWCNTCQPFRFVGRARGRKAISAFCENNTADEWMNRKQWHAMKWVDFLLLFVCHDFTSVIWYVKINIQKQQWNTSFFVCVADTFLLIFLYFFFYIYFFTFWKLQHGVWKAVGN